MKLTPWFFCASVLLTPPIFAGDRAISVGDYLYLADEPGLADCPDFACNIPVDLVIQKRLGGHYQEANRLELTRFSSGDHTLYQANQKIVSVFSNRLQEVGKRAQFITRITAFSIEDPLNPHQQASAKVPGELIASQKLGTRIATLSAEVIDPSGGGDMEQGDDSKCTWFHRDETLPMRVKVHLLSVDVEAQQAISQQCLLLDTQGLSSIDLGAGDNSLHLLLSDGERHRVYRYHWLKQQLSLHGYAELPQQFAYQRPTDWVVEQPGYLLVAGQFPGGGGLRSAIGVYPLQRDQTSYRLAKTIRIGSEESWLDSASKVSSDKRWYLATSDGNGAQLHALSVLLPGLPFEQATTPLESAAQTIIPHENHLVSVYRTAFPLDGLFDPQQWLTLIDNSNAFKLWTIAQQQLAKGFDQQALATSDSRRQTLHWTTRSSAKLLNIVEKPIFAQGDQAGETPIGRAVDLKTATLERQYGCLPIIHSCWTMSTGIEHNFELPYFGAEPIRAVVTPEDKHFHYLLGDESQTLAW